MLDPAERFSSPRFPVIPRVSNEQFRAGRIWLFVDLPTGDLFECDPKGSSELLKCSAVPDRKPVPQLYCGAISYGGDFILCPGIQVQSLLIHIRSVAFDCKARGQQPNDVKQPMVQIFVNNLLQHFLGFRMMIGSCLDEAASLAVQWRHRRLWFQSNPDNRWSFSLSSYLLKATLAASLLSELQVTETLPSQLRTASLDSMFQKCCISLVVTSYASLKTYCWPTAR